MTRLQIQHPGAVAIIAQPSDDTVVLVRQFRYAVAAWTWEIPAGTCAEAESWQATARRDYAKRRVPSAASRSGNELLPAPGLTDEVLYLVKLVVVRSPERGAG